MMRQLLFLLLLSFAFFSQGLLFGQTKQLATYDDPTAYEVYAAVLSLAEPSHRSKPTNFVIRQETIRNFGAFTDTEPSRGVCLRPDPEFERIVGPAISDYVRVNRMKWLLKDELTLTVPYRLVPSEKILSLIQKEGWNAFYKKYPDAGGFIDLSAVGFNAEKTVAVVSKGRWCGDLCGEGNYQVLQKKDGTWIPLDWEGTKCSWVS